MKYNTVPIFFYLTTVLGRFFHGSRTEFLDDLDPDSEKKADQNPRKKTGSETLAKTKPKLQRKDYPCLVSD